MYDVTELDNNGDDKKDLSKQIHFLLCEICFLVRFKFIFNNCVSCKMS